MITGLVSLCGKTVAVENGHDRADGRECAEGEVQEGRQAGRDGSAFPDQNEANLGISSGRAQVGMADSPVAAYIVKQSQGQFKLTGKSYGTAPYGIALPKGDGMAKPILDAVKVLMRTARTSRSSPSGAPGRAISNPKINGATSLAGRPGGAPPSGRRRTRSRRSRFAIPAAGSRPS